MTCGCCGTAGWVGCSLGTYAPSTLGSFLRSFRFGHVRQLDAVAARFLAGLAARSPLVAGAGTVLVDVDDTIIEVHGYAKQGAGFGYSKVRGWNALLATAASAESAPVVVAQRLPGARRTRRAARNGWSPTPSRLWLG